MPSCVSFSSASKPSVSPTAEPSANAYQLQLPAGAVIVLPTQQAAAQVRAVAINEIDPFASGDTITLRTPLLLVSPAYIAERDARELQLHELIFKLRDTK